MLLFFSQSICDTDTQTHTDTHTHTHTHTSHQLHSALTDQIMTQNAMSRADVIGCLQSAAPVKGLLLRLLAWQNFSKAWWVLMSNFWNLGWWSYSMCQTWHVCTHILLDTFMMTSVVNSSDRPMYQQLIGWHLTFLNYLCLIACAEWICLEFWINIFPIKSRTSYFYLLSANRLWFD